MAEIDSQRARGSVNPSFSGGTRDSQLLARRKRLEGIARRIRAAAYGNANG